MDSEKLTYYHYYNTESSILYEIIVNIGIGR